MDKMCARQKVSRDLESLWKSPRLPPVRGDEFLASGRPLDDHRRCWWGEGRWGKLCAGQKVNRDLASL